jgi:hypothetical protein
LFDSSDPTGVPLNASFQVLCSLPVETASARRAVHIEPAPEGGTNSSAYWRDLEITSPSDYEPLTRYTVTVDTTLRAMNGLLLETPVTFSFTTGVFGLTTTTPRRHDAGVALNASIWASFTARLDTSTVRRAFSISPPVEGTVYGLPGHGFLQFYHMAAFRPFTAYTVTIDTALRSQRGLQLKEPYTFTFTTGGE